MRVMFLIAYLLMIGVVSGAVSQAADLPAWSTEWWCKSILVGVVFGGLWVWLVGPWIDKLSRR